MWLHPALVLFVYFVSYLIVGLVESAIGLRNERRALKAGHPVEEDDEEEEDYL